MAVTSLDQFMTNRGYVLVPTKRGIDNRPFVNALINGKRIRALIDTGSSETLIDRRFVKARQRSPKPQQDRNAAFGQIRDQLEGTTLERLQLGTLTYTNLEASTFDLRKDLAVHLGSFIPRSEGLENSDLVLGMAFLKAANAFLDCRAPTLYIRQGPPGDPLKKSIEQSFRASGYAVVPAPAFECNMLLARVSFNASEATLLVDTGASFTTIDLNQLESLKLSNREQMGHMTDVGGNKAALSYTKVDQLRIGSFELSKYPLGTCEMNLATLNQKLKTFGGPTVSGLLGPDLLDRAGVLIDCASVVLYSRP